MAELDWTAKFQLFTLHQQIIGRTEQGPIKVFSYLQQVISNTKTITNEWYRSYSWRNSIG